MSLFKNFALSFKKGLKKINFQGRSSRNEVLQISVLTPIILGISTIAYCFLSYGIGIMRELFPLFFTGLVILLSMIFANTLASIAAIGRRFQDLGLSGWLALPLIFLSPVIYMFIGLLLLILPSTKNNKYGPNLEGYDISSADVENYIYFKYFSSNPIHANMSINDCLDYNKKKADLYSKKLTSEIKKEFDNLMCQSIDNNYIDFSQSLPNLQSNQQKIKELIHKHDLQNLDYQKLFSSINDYSAQTQFNAHNKEING